MKLTTTIFCVLLFICNLHSQEAIGTVKYRVTSNYATSGISYYSLSFNKIESLYESISSQKEISSYTEVISDWNGDQFDEYIESSNKDTSYYYKSLDIFLFREIYIDKSFYVDDDFELDWQLSNEKKSIEDFICNKATIKFRGRDYIVWYTEEIPFPYGPWKFSGLPGLILEIEELKGVYTIEAFKVDIAFDQSKPLKPDVDNFDFISFEEYIFQKEQVRQEELKIFQSKLPKNVQLDLNCERCNVKLELLD